MSAVCSLILLFIVPLSLATNTRYLTYTVNLGEGFNLRRDVHIRAANLVLHLHHTTQYHWILVLPPWPHLYHWKSSLDQTWLPWKRFFDVAELDRYVPSIEFEDYVTREGHVIDEVLYLQDIELELKEGRLIDKAIEEACHSRLPYRKDRRRGTWEGDVFGYVNVKISKLTCYGFQGTTTGLSQVLGNKSHNSKSFLVGELQQVLHETFGDLTYWNARRSMVYSQQLRQFGGDFMKEHLHYDPGKGKGRSPPLEGGGDYISVHLRRADYMRAHPDLVPSLEGVASQIQQIVAEQSVSKIFLATDASIQEKMMLRQLLEDSTVWYQPTDDHIRHYGDGGVAIIDQWIAAHAKYFIGTSESTFSYRIREDRQMMNFSIESTFNQLCGPSHNEMDYRSCPTPSKWTIVHDKPRRTNSKVEL